MEWKTRVTELLHCKYPILLGAMHKLGTWQFGAAVSEAGGHGVLTASVSKTAPGLREDIKRFRDATDKPFSVNLSFGVVAEPLISEMLEVCIKERTPVETAMYKPDSLAPRIKEAGLTWIHKTARIVDAIHAEKLGADAVIVVGLEGTGFKHPYQLPTMTTALWASRQLKVPFIAAGGIGDGRGLMSALVLGGDAIMMGTAFITTNECPFVTDTTKKAMLQLRPDDPAFIHHQIHPPDPKAYREAMELRGKMPVRDLIRVIHRVTSKEKGELISDADLQRWLVERPVVKMGSFASAYRRGICTVKELIDQIIQEAEEIRNVWR